MPAPSNPENLNAFPKTFQQGLLKKKDANEFAQTKRQVYRFFCKK
ncbi:hypothetical protein Chls_727 [Chlamydia suis]|uniref:Uncharacterized protein n=1 Tax=Chlamydia suis TaxID=83559 RepID=A0ABX6IRR6_9CHLA|nr:hypothetical protein Chls_727 [Chlamydia suis]